jgi:hypothetical protein
MLRHCRQQCGELAGIVRRRALNVRLADKNRYKSADFRKPPKRDESSFYYASAGIEQGPHPVAWQ